MPQRQSAKVSDTLRSAQRRDALAATMGFHSGHLPQRAGERRQRRGRFHGGGVAAPIATRIMERTLAMDAGTFEPQVAWLAPAHHSNPFVSIKEVTFKDAQTNVAGADEEHGDDSQTPDTQMAGGGGDPAVELEADAQGKVSARQARVARALPVATPPPQQNFFQRLFGGRRNQAPLPTPPPARRPGGR